MPVGTEFPTMTAKEFAKAIKIGDDGFSIKDIHGIPKWAQARSEQNGYYSEGVDLIIRDDIDELCRNDQIKEEERSYFVIGN